MFRGSIPALVTPFRNGEIDFPAFDKLVELQIEGGSGALVPCGTTGESPTLSHDEHRAVVERCVKVTRGRVPVIAGCGSNSTIEAIELAQFAKEVGADAGLSVVPYYNRPDQRGMIAHFTAIADAVPLPLFLYNVPGRTACDIAVETVATLSRHPNIIGIKDASGDVTRVTRHKHLCAEGFILLSGDDPNAIGFNAMGGEGCISVTANVAPKLMADIQAASLAGDLETARALEAKAFRLHKALFLSPSPGPTKYALSKLGLCDSEVRSPVLAPDEAVCREIDAAMEQAGVI